MGVITQRVPGLRGVEEVRPEPGRPSSAWTPSPSAPPVSDSRAVSMASRPAVSRRRRRQPVAVAHRLGGASPGGLALPPAAPTPEPHVRPARRLDRRRAGGGRRHRQPPRADLALLPDAGRRRRRRRPRPARLHQRGPGRGRRPTPSAACTCPPGSPSSTATSSSPTPGTTGCCAWDGLPDRRLRRARRGCSARRTSTTVEPNRGGEPDLRDLLLAVRLRRGRRRLLGGRHRQPARARLARRRPARARRGPPTSCSARTTATRPRGQPRRARRRDHVPLAARRRRRRRRRCSSPTPATTGCSAGRPRRTPTGPPTSSSASPTSTTTDEFKNRPQGAAAACASRTPWRPTRERSVVADTSNNRVLRLARRPRAGAGLRADTVLAQPDMDANGENRWTPCTDDSLCWPYGLCLAGDLLAIADSGNNRVMLWRPSDDRPAAVAVARSPAWCRAWASARSSTASPPTSGSTGSSATTPRASSSRSRATRRRWPIRSRRCRRGAAAGRRRARHDVGRSPRSDERGFRIVDEPRPDGRHRRSIPPDTAVCADCLAEMRDPATGVTATRSSPARTAARATRSSRACPTTGRFTTMAGFPLCPPARRSTTTRGRRFHAQPTACPDCGPRVCDTRRRPHDRRGASRRRSHRRASRASAATTSPATPADAAAVAGCARRKQRGDKPFASWSRPRRRRDGSSTRRRPPRGARLAGAPDRARARQRTADLAGTRVAPGNASSA